MAMTGMPSVRTRIHTILETFEAFKILSDWSMVPNGTPTECTGERCMQCSPLLQ